MDWEGDRERIDRVGVLHLGLKRKDFPVLETTPTPAAPALVHTVLKSYIMLIIFAIFWKMLEFQRFDTPRGYFQSLSKMEILPIFGL